MTSCEKARIKNCMYCNYYKYVIPHKPGRHAFCYIEVARESLRGAAMTENHSRFKEYLFKNLVYSNNKTDIDGNPSINYVIGAVKLYWPQHIDTLNKMLILL